MLKIKLFAGLAVLAASLFAMTATAMAVEFESDSSSNQGKVVKFPEKSVFAAKSGGAAVECKNATKEPWAQWVLQNKKTPNEVLQIKKWGNCVGPTLLAATVKCNLEVNAGGTGSVPASGCAVLIGTEAGNHCLLKVGSTGNQGLKEVTLENATNSQGGPLINIESNISGITSTSEESPAGFCKANLGIETSSTGTFKTEGKPLVTEGQKLV